MKPPYRHHFFTAFLCLLCFNLFSQKVSISPIPSWVTVNSYDPSSDFGIEDAQNGYLDLAYEYQTNAAPVSSFFKSAMKVLNESGIEAVSKVTVDFDPTFQNLQFHTVRILREGKEINQLSQSKIKTINQEKDLDQNLYNGSLTAMIILDDVRKGDVVEYSYSIMGGNPVFKGRFAKSFMLQFRVPISHIYYKAVCPASRTLNLKTIGSNIQPTISKTAAAQVYEWKLSNSEALPAPEMLPTWYDPYGVAFLSEYTSWKDVSNWALQLFPEQKNLSPELKEKINEIQSTYKTKEEQIGAALRFVQDDVRYMGIEVGANSHQPAHPDKIFAQRYGDCKDKTYLFCTMLKEMSIEAYPVLINTYYTKSLLDWIPSANAFDHVIATVRTAERDYWFDPTISYQRGIISNISFPDYKVGLIVSPNTTELTVIDQKEPGEVDIQEVFDIKKGGAATFTVTTRYSGTFADEVRSSFHSSSRNEILKTYLSYYHSYHDKIESDSISYKDDTASGTFIVNEYYSFESIWEMIDGKKKAVFSPYIILGLIKKPTSGKRTTPFSIGFPAKYHEQVIVNLPEDWDAEEDNDYVITDPFEIRFKTTYQNGQIILDYNYEAKQDHVAPEKLAEYMSAIDKIDNHFSYHVTADPGESSAKKKSTPAFYYGLIALVLIGAGAWFYHWRK